MYGRGLHVNGRRAEREGRCIGLCSRIRLSAPVVRSPAPPAARREPHLSILSLAGCLPPPPWSAEGDGNRTVTERGRPTSDRNRVDFENRVSVSPGGKRRKEARGESWRTREHLESVVSVRGTGVRLTFISPEMQRDRNLDSHWVHENKSDDDVSSIAFVINFWNCKETLRTLCIFWRLDYSESILWQL